MPYIKQERRDRLDAKLTPLIYRLANSESDYPAGAGDLTYVIFRLLVHLFMDEPRYYRSRALHGALLDAWDEFRERYVKDYEREKREENGDVI